MLSASTLDEPLAAEVAGSRTLTDFLEKSNDINAEESGGGTGHNYLFDQWLT